MQPDDPARLASRLDGCDYTGITDTMQGGRQSEVHIKHNAEAGCAQ